MQALPPALAALSAFRQFTCYALVPSQSRPGKTDKIPTSPLTGRTIDAHDPAHWVDAHTACATAASWGPSYGVGFSVRRDNGLFFLDLDNHLGADGQWSPLAQQMCGMFAGAAVEVSQSGRGLHIIGRAQAPEHGCKRADLGVDLYTDRRFIALTGNAVGDAGSDHTAALRHLVAHVFPPGAGRHEGTFVLSAAPVPEWRGPADDDELVRRALNSRSAAASFGNKASFADLWNADIDALSKAYPDPARAYDASAADAALVAHLSFWTGKHGERIERIMRRSALARDKWDRGGDDYLARSICEVTARSGDVLQDKLIEPSGLPPAPTSAPVQTDITGQTFLTAEGQRELFSGCIYIVDQHRVLVPGGKLLKPEQFRTNFGGRVFALDDINQRTTRNAWEAFTESTLLRAPRADTICFRPQDPFGALHDNAGFVAANTWWPATVRRVQGDASPFADLLGKLFPHEGDRSIMLAYMAACVQFPGRKFQWCPVVQGVEGNGKTTLSLCVAEAIGQRYVHWPKAPDLLSGFNKWVSNTVFVGVEELQAADMHTQQQVIESLKTLITGAMGIQIQPKGVDQYSAAIVCNFMATTNYKTAVRKTPDNARRFAMFFTPQQSYSDLVRDGMDGDYFPRLYDWLRNRDGFAIVAELLAQHPIPDALNPATVLHRAPRTTTTDDAIVESRGHVEQTILEAIALGEPGCAGGWVSSRAIERVLDGIGMSGRIAPTRRKAIMQELGYVLHPGLLDGRVSNAVQPDGAKVQLFVPTGSPQSLLTGPGEIARAYSAAQAPVTVRG